MGRSPAAHQHALEEGALLGRQLHAGHRGGGERPAGWSDRCPGPRVTSVGCRGNGTQRTPAGGPGGNPAGAKMAVRARPPPRAAHAQTHGREADRCLVPGVRAGWVQGCGFCHHLMTKPLTYLYFWSLFIAPWLLGFSPR